jgi:hypothetical protein
MLGTRASKGSMPDAKRPVNPIPSIYRREAIRPAFGLNRRGNDDGGTRVRIDGALHRVDCLGPRSLVRGTGSKRLSLACDWIPTRHAATQCFAGAQSDAGRLRVFLMALVQALYCPFEPHLPRLRLTRW